MQLIPFSVTFFSLFFLIIANYYFKSKMLLKALNLVFLTESFVLSFAFEKYPFAYSLPILILSIYLLFLNSSSSKVKSIIPNEAHYRSYITAIGMILIVLTFVYDLTVGDNVLSNNSFLVIVFSIFLIFYYDLPPEINKEKSFLLIFISLNLIIWVFLPLLYKSSTQTYGQTVGDGWISNDSITHIFLAAPLTKLLNLFGFYAFTSDGVLTFVNLKTERLNSVAIAESCSGIYSSVIFITALFSYIISERYPINSHTVLIFVLGIMTSYFANLFRMFLVVLTGHYFGIEKMTFVHEYLGWIIFSLWVFLFWYFLLNNFYEVKPEA